MASVSFNLNFYSIHEVEHLSTGLRAVELNKFAHLFNMLQDDNVTRRYVMRKLSLNVILERSPPRILVLI